jgi:hypothetical protein
MKSPAHMVASGMQDFKERGPAFQQWAATVPPNQETTSARAGIAGSSCICVSCIKTQPRYVYENRFPLNFECDLLFI